MELSLYLLQIMTDFAGDDDVDFLGEDASEQEKAADADGRKSSASDCSVPCEETNDVDDGPERERENLGKFCPFKDNWKRFEVSEEVFQVEIDGWKCERDLLTGQLLKDQLSHWHDKQMISLSNEKHCLLVRLLINSVQVRRRVHNKERREKVDSSKAP